MLPDGRELVAHSQTTYLPTRGLRENTYGLAFRRSPSASIHEEHSGSPGCKASRPKVLAGGAPMRKSPVIAGTMRFLFTCDS